MPITTIKIIEDIFTDEQKAQMIHEVTEAMVRVTGEEKRSGNWVLIDCNDAIVHVFDPETRGQYDLERLWRDAPRLDLEIEGVDPNPSAVENIEVEGGVADPAA